MREWRRNGSKLRKKQFQSATLAPKHRAAEAWPININRFITLSSLIYIFRCHLWFWGWWRCSWRIQCWPALEKDLAQLRAVIANMRIHEREGLAVRVVSAKDFVWPQSDGRLNAGEAEPTELSLFANLLRKPTPASPVNAANAEWRHVATASDGAPWNARLVAARSPCRSRRHQHCKLQLPRPFPELLSIPLPMSHQPTPCFSQSCSRHSHASCVLTVVPININRFVYSELNFSQTCKTPYLY